MTNLGSLFGFALIYRASAQLFHQAPLSTEQIQELERKNPIEAPVGDLTIHRPTICDGSVKQYSGYLQLGNSSTKYFFWLMESRSAPETDPLVMWLNGGPGCSSMMGMLAENGPCKVSQDGQNTTRNPYSWNSKANVMWVDQPAGAGFSTGSYIHNEQEVGEAMYQFLQAFFKSLPQYQKNEFFVTGESYAGHYVPAITHRIWQGIKNKDGFSINLKGLGIGNGLVDPQVQYKYYAPMAYDGGKSEGGSLEKGAMGKTATDLMAAAAKACVAAITECNKNSTASCVSAFALCNYGEMVPYELTGLNPYDMRKPCDRAKNGMLCYDFSNVQKYLDSSFVQKEIGVSKPWDSCNHVVNIGFMPDWMHNYQVLLPEMLADGIRVLVYAGDVDFICNWLGNKHWTLEMEWPNKEAYNAAADKPYTLNGKEVGRIRTANGFSFVQVYQAGHMVPMDQPEVALDMINNFIFTKAEEIMV
jgi:cathepsin A (carboxypeptidase C)